MDLHVAAAKQLALIDSVLAEYRATWSSLPNGPPYPCDFSGGRTDVRVLDFIEYEGLRHPRGLFGAAIAWGNVIAGTGVLKWLVNEANDYMLGTIEFPRILVWPLARIIEIEHSSSPQFGKFAWLLEETVARCLCQDIDDEEERRLLRLLDPDPDYGFNHSTHYAIQRIRESIEGS